MKHLSLAVIAVVLFTTHAFALTYDPETNTYIDDTPTQTSSTTTQNDTEQEDVSSQEQQETQESSVTSTTTTQTTTSSSTYDGPLVSLHQLLDQYQQELQDYIDDTYQSLQEMVATSSDTVALQQRLDVLQCVGIVDDEFGIVDDIKTTQKQLRTKVRVVVTDTHSEIEALETKIEEDLLDQFEENLEIAVIQNKVESLLTEYTNVIDTYFDLSTDEINALKEDIEENNSSYQAVLDNYDKRKKLLEDLEDEYETFTSKSSFVGVVVGPSLGEVREALDEIKRFYRVQFMGEWSDTIGSHLAGDSITFQDQARTRFNRAFNEYMNALLDDLYPLADIEQINKEMVTLRTAYTNNDGEYDCRGLATNPNIDANAPKLIETMDEVLVALNTSANQVATSQGKLPKDADELEEQLLEYAQQFIQDEQDILLRDEKIRVESSAGTSRRTSTVNTQYRTWQKTVRTFLLAQYQSALQKDRLTTFENKLRTALSKIETIKSGISGKTLQMVEAIESVIKEFL